jgi:hypothetical protein
VDFCRAWFDWLFFRDPHMAGDQVMLTRTVLRLFPALCTTHVIIFWIWANADMSLDLAVQQNTKLLVERLDISDNNDSVCDHNQMAPRRVWRRGWLEITLDIHMVYLLVRGAINDSDVSNVLAVCALVCRGWAFC